MYAQGVTVGLWPPRVAIPCPAKLIGGDPERTRPSSTALANRALAAEHGYDYAAIPGTEHLLSWNSQKPARQSRWSFWKGSEFDNKAPLPHCGRGV